MAGAGVIYMDNPDSAGAALFHMPSAEMQSYIGQSMQGYLAAVQSVAPDFANNIKKRYAEIVNSTAVQYAKNIKNRVNSLWQTDSIRFLPNIDKVQQAPDIMRKYIMAMPELRDRWQNSGLSGYDKKYVDEFPNTIGKTHYDYRRVTEGVIRKVDDTVECSIYYEKLLNSGDILDSVQKAVILASWDIIDNSLESDDNRDPTSVWNATL